MAVPTSGRVILETTQGDIEIELWAKETPKTCRNFIALSMEGYYDGVIFHRIIPNFLVQTGDRTGTGGGGESFYGEPFEDEIHPRLRFAHRGLVAMANNGEKNTNDSQFFITLDRADELHGKHTLFGRVVGNTVFNVLKIGESETDKNERPLYPPKIKSVRIIDNPFDDIVPRITAAEKQAQRLAREQSAREREEAARRKGAKKNVGLLSFGDTAEDEPAPEFKTKKAIARPDLVDDSSLLANLPPPPVSSKSRAAASSDEPPQSSSWTPKPLTSVKPEWVDSQRKEKESKKQPSESSNRAAEIAKMEASIRSLTRRRSGSLSGDEEGSSSKKKAKKSGPSALEQELAKYRSKSSLTSKTTSTRGDGLGGKSKKKDESETLAMLERFRSKLKGAAAPASSAAEKTDMDVDGEVNEAEEGLEVDNDTDWMSHELHFPKDNNEEVYKAEHEYEVIDPRARGAAAKEEEAARRKREGKGRSGGLQNRRR